MKKFKRKYRLTLMEGILGTKAGDPETYEKYILSKRPEGVDEEEKGALPPLDEAMEKASTIFCRNEDGQPIIFDYQVKGFFKDTQAALAKAGDPGDKLTAFKKVIDGNVFVYPRMIELNKPEGSEHEWCERPLRAQTPQGERISLARSEEIPAGTTLDIEIMILNEALWKNVETWLEYGELRGLGQWRNSGKGRFTYERLDEEPQKKKAAAKV